MKCFLCAVVVFFAILSCKATPNVSFEHAQRVKNQLERLLAATHLATTQTQHLFSHGLAINNNNSSAAQHNHSLAWGNATTLRLAAHTFLQAPSPQPTGIRIVTQGLFLAISPTNLQLLTQEQFQLPNEQQSCAPGSGQHVTCAGQFRLASESSPVPVSFERSVAIALDSQFSNVSSCSTLPCWQPIITSSSSTVLSTLTTPWLEYVGELNNEEKQSVGYVGVGFSLEELQSVIDTIVDESSTATEDVAIMLIDDSTKSIIAVSNTSASYSAPLSPCGRLPVSASLCLDPELREFAVRVVNSPNQDEQEVLVEADLFATLAPVRATGLSWHVLVVRRMTITHDMVAFDSVAGVTFCVFETIMLAISLFLIAWIVRYQDLQLWQVGQPWMMILVLVACVGLVVCAFVHLGPHTKLSCGAQEWLMTLCITLVAATGFSKLLRVHMNLNNILRLEGSRKQMDSHHAATVVGLLMALQVLILVYWQITAPLQPTLTYRANFGELQGFIRCDSSNPFAFNAVRLLPLIVIIGAAYLAVKTRNLSPMFAESRALMSVCIHGLVLAVVVGLVYQYGEVTYANAVIQGQGALLWFSMTMQMAVFFPRVMRQIDQGDLTFDEVKQMMVQHVKHAIKTEKTFEKLKQIEARKNKNQARAVFGKPAPESQPEFVL